MRYINEEYFTQNLITRQDEIDRVLKIYVKQEYEKEMERVKGRIAHYLLPLFCPMKVGFHTIHDCMETRTTTKREPPQKVVDLLIGTFKKGLHCLAGVITSVVLDQYNTTRRLLHYLQQNS